MATLWIITGQNALQVVSGSLTGTGLVHLTNGVIDSAAWPFELGTSTDQLIVTNHAGTDTAAITAAGDLAYASSSFTVTGIQTRPVASTAPTNGQALVWNSGAGQWQPGSAGTTGPTGTGLWYSTSGTLNSAAITLTGDLSQGTLSGSNVPEYVQSISGASGSGGAVTLGATVVLTASAGAGGLSLGSWTGATTLPTGNLSWAGASAKTLSLVGASTFTLTGGATSTWSVTSGNLTVDAAATLNLGTTNATGVAIGNTSNNGSITLSTKGGGGYSVTGAAGGTFTFNIGNGSGDYLWLGAQGSNAAVEHLPTGLTFQNAVSTPTWQQTALASTAAGAGAAGQNAAFYAQAGQASTHSNSNGGVGGNVNLYPGPGGSPGTGGNPGNPGIVNVYGGSAGSTLMASLGDYGAAGGSIGSYGALYLKQSSISTTDYALLADGTNLWLNAAGGSGNLNFAAANATTVTLLGSALGTMQWASGVTAILSQAQLGSTGSTVGLNFTIQAQQGQAQSGSSANNAGGWLYLKPGAPGTGGSGAAGLPGLVQVYGGASGTTPIVTIGDYGGASGGGGIGSFGALWFAQSSPSNTNYSFLGQSGGTYFNVPGGGVMYFAFSNSVSLELTNAALYPATSGALTLGTSSDLWGTSYIGGGNGAYYAFLQANSSTHDAQEGIVSRQVFFFKTTNTSANVAATIGIPSGTWVSVRVHWTARFTGTTSSGGGGEVVQCFYNSSGTVSQQNTTVAGSTTQVLWAGIAGGGSPVVASPTFGVSGGSFTISVTANNSAACDWQLDVYINNC